MSRYTRKDAVKAVELLCEVLGKPYGTYVKNETGGLVGNGGYSLDYNPTYGGCVIHEFLTDSTGVNTPFGLTRLPIREFIQAVHISISSLCLTKNPPKDRGIRLVIAKFSHQFVEHLGAELYGPGLSVIIGQLIPNINATTKEGAEYFSKMCLGYADMLGLYYDRSQLDEWLKEQE